MCFLHIYFCYLGGWSSISISSHSGQNPKNHCKSPWIIWNIPTKHDIPNDISSLIRFFKVNPCESPNNPTIYSCDCTHIHIHIYIPLYPIFNILPLLPPFTWPLWPSSWARHLWCFARRPQSLCFSKRRKSDDSNGCEWTVVDPYICLCFWRQHQQEAMRVWIFWVWGWVGGWGWGGVGC